MVVALVLCSALRTSNGIQEGGGGGALRLVGASNVWLCCAQLGAAAAERPMRRNQRPVELASLRSGFVIRIYRRVDGRT